VRTPLHAFALAALLTVAGDCAAQVKITGATAVAPYALVRLRADGVPDDAGLIWRASPRKGVSRATTDQRVFEFAAPPGAYEIDLIVVRLVDKKTVVEEASATVTIGQPAPPVTPAPPVPPGPGPAPPAPPSPAPIDAPGFRVFIIEETADRARLPAKQLDVLFNASVRAYLKSHCVKDAHNPDGAFRIWDKDVDASDPSLTVWARALKAFNDRVKDGKAKPPWLIVSDGKTGYEGPLPADAGSALQLLKKYGGE
jgi:hypothetical protein